MVYTSILGISFVLCAQGRGLLGRGNYRFLENHLYKAFANYRSEGRNSLQGCGEMLCLFYHNYSLLCLFYHNYGTVWIYLEI